MFVVCVAKAKEIEYDAPENHQRLLLSSRIEVKKDMLKKRLLKKRLDNEEKNCV